MKKILTCLLATLGLTSACGQQNFENADVQGFSKLITDSGVVLLDVRTTAEYAEGHIEVDVFKTQSGKTVKCHALTHASIRIQNERRTI